MFAWVISMKLDSNPVTAEMRWTKWLRSMAEAIGNRQWHLFYRQRSQPVKAVTCRTLLVIRYSFSCIVVITIVLHSWNNSLFIVRCTLVLNAHCYCLQWLAWTGFVLLFANQNFHAREFSRSSLHLIWRQYPFRYCHWHCRHCSSWLSLLLLLSSSSNSLFQYFH